MIIDFRAKPPIPLLAQAVASPPEYMQGYQETYREQDSGDFGRFAQAPFDEFLKHLDKHGVSRIVAVAADARTTVGRYVPNDVIADLQAKYPDRIIGFAGADPHRGMEAVRELERAVKERGLKGLNLGPWLHMLHANDRKFYPLYAKCVELGIPVVLHTSINFSRRLSMDFGRPIYLDDVAMYFPDLRIIASHAGWPWVPEMVAVAWRHPNIFIEISGIRPKYLGMPNSGWEVLLQHGRTTLKNRILFGTDWPLFSYETALADFRELPLSEDVQERWLWRNATRLLGLKEQ